MFKEENVSKKKILHWLYSNIRNTWILRESIVHIIYIHIIKMIPFKLYKRCKHESFAYSAKIHREVSYDVDNPEIHCYTFRIMKVSNTWNADTKHISKDFYHLTLVHQMFLSQMSETEKHRKKYQKANSSCYEYNVEFYLSKVNCSSSLLLMFLFSNTYSRIPVILGCYTWSIVTLFIVNTFKWKYCESEEVRMYEV